MNQRASLYENFFFFSSTDNSCQYWVNKTTLTSPYYPKYYLADDIGCEWIITAPEGHIIALEFDYFSVSFSKKYYYIFVKKLGNTNICFFYLPTYLVV